MIVFDIRENVEKVIDNFRNGINDINLEQHRVAVSDKDVAFLCKMYIDTVHKALQKIRTNKTRRLAGFCEDLLNEILIMKINLKAHPLMLKKSRKFLPNLECAHWIKGLSIVMGIIFINRNFSAVKYAN